MISAKIIADSLAPCGKRLTTFILKYPRFIHAEIMTHRELSRNAASSRAIPVEKMIKSAEEDMAYPIYWGKNQKGMQAGEQLSPEDIEECKSIFWACSQDSISYVRGLSYKGLHKQVANRLLEPFIHMTIICSGTEWENFFALRCHKDAQPEFQNLAFQMLQLYLENSPKKLTQGEWHIPFGDMYLGEELTLPLLLKIGTARCARVSYLNFEGNIEHEKDYKLHDDLLESGHMSPFEHCARAESQCINSGNFSGFTQYRKTIPGERKKLSRADMELLLLNYKKG